MKNLKVTQEVMASADKAWTILRTGTGLEKWIPIVASCKLEGHGEGAKRTCITPEGKTLKETIVLIDDQNKVFKYRIDEQDVLPTKNYVGTVSIIESMGKTEIHWGAEFEMTMEEAYPQVEEGLTAIFKAAITGLDKLACM